MGNPTHLLWATNLGLVSVLIYRLCRVWIDLAVLVSSLCSPQITTTGHPSSSAFSFPFLESRQSRARQTNTTLSGFHVLSGAGITKNFVEKGNLRGYCTSYQKLACFVLYLSIINNSLKNKLCIL